ncbi:MAG: hypothetical protein IIC07_05860, partial [Proteobacteria bacterium]|nr:hypothetical protein [Pseudomonadota bacterium]
MGEVLNYDIVGRIGRLIGFILVLTLAAEALGAAAMFGHWVDRDGQTLEASAQLYYSIYHSVSAFCNAGFSLHSDSLVRYQGQWPMMLPMSMLIILGGIGFTVVLD